jgi:hypothetical protein
MACGLTPEGHPLAGKAVIEHGDGEGRHQAEAGETEDDHCQ